MDLARNNLTKVDFQMFSDLRFIDTIDLAENQITEIQREAFKNMYLTKVRSRETIRNSITCDEIADSQFLKMLVYFSKGERQPQLDHGDWRRCVQERREHDRLGHELQPDHGHPTLGV